DSAGLLLLGQVQRADQRFGAARRTAAGGERKCCREEAGGGERDAKASRFHRASPCVMRQRTPVFWTAFGPFLSTVRMPKSRTYSASPLRSKRQAMGRSKPAVLRSDAGPLVLPWLTA